MRRISFTVLVPLLAGALLAAGCATERTDDAGLALDGDEASQPDERTSNEVVDDALADVEAFWSRSYEDLYGQPYEPISGGFWPYGPTSEQPPCGAPVPAYEEIARNAFYCPSADLIVWDADQLTPRLYEEFGAFTLGIVFAHEFGHAVQERAGTEGPTIMRELQADCFAGAWTADVEAGGSDHFDVDSGDLDKTIAGFLALRDEVGVGAGNPAAHGTAFDRIGAFVEGYEGGVERCAAYPEDLAAGELVVVEIPFTRQDDFERGGNLPIDQLGPVLIEDLEDFWSKQFEALGETWTPVEDVVLMDPATQEVECGDDTYRGDVLEGASFYCVDSNTIYLDGVGLLPTLEAVGDYAVVTEIARQYAFAAQAQLGDLDNTIESNLQADCFAGLYARSGFTGDRGEDQQLTLSPGDLDEAVIAFLSNSDASNEVEDGEASVGTAFQRFKAYRAGFLEGSAACG